MSWNEVPVVEQRKEFVVLAGEEGANVSLLCRRFGISRKTGYKWLSRAAAGEERWAWDRSRAPRRCPQRTAEEVELAVEAVRRRYPFWGARKLRRKLEEGGHRDLPSASTITEILRRRGLLLAEESAKRGPMERFERGRPNELWQMDFKGAVVTGEGQCHPLTVIDDHSRYAVCVRALGHEREEVVRPALEVVFRTHGLPERMLMDNGSCWGNAEARYTRFCAWLIRLGIGISHGRPYHPQTQGKNERFNRTLAEEALRGRNFGGLADCQREFDLFRRRYNHERPHEALGYEVPASRYRVSSFEYPARLPVVEYGEGDVVRRVGPAGYVSYCSQRYQVGRAFTGELVGLRRGLVDGILEVYYCHQRVAQIDLRTQQCVQV